MKKFTFLLVAIALFSLLALITSATFTYDTSKLNVSEYQILTSTAVVFNWTVNSTFAGASSSSTFNCTVYNLSGIGNTGNYTPLVGATEINTTNNQTFKNITVTMPEGRHYWYLNCTQRTGTSNTSVATSIRAFDVDTDYYTLTLGADQLINFTLDTGAMSVMDATINNTLNFKSTNTPSTPAANNLKFYSQVTQGHTRPVIMDDDGVEFVVNRDNVFIGRNTQGATITKGQVVRINGSTGNVPNIALANANSSSTLPAVGVAIQNINPNSFGNIMIIGVITNIDTSTFSTGERIYVSDTVNGAITNVRTSYPNLTQRMGSVLVSGVGNGALYITTAPFIGGEETGTISSVYSASNVSVKNMSIGTGSIYHNGTHLVLVG